MKSRLFYKVFGTYLIIIFLTVAFFYLLAWKQTESFFTETVETSLMNYARLVDLSSRDEIRKQVKNISAISKARVTLMDENGTVLADSERNPAEMENHLNRPEIQEARFKGQGSTIRYSRTIGMDMLYVAFPVKEDRFITGYVRLARPLVEVKHATEKMKHSLIISILIMIIPSFLIAVLFSYRLTVPIKAMEMFTERLRRGREPGSLFIETGDEMKKLAENINYLVLELQNQIRTANTEKEKLVTAFASMSEGILVLDSESRIEISNLAFKKMFGAQFGDVTGKTLIEAFRSIALQNAFDRFRSTGEQLSEEITIGDETAPVTLNVSFSKIRGEEEKTILVFHDVTRLKKLERMRMDFVANVSHEIKTPLTAILGFVETLQSGALDDKETTLRFLDIIHKHAQRLNRLLDDLLTISNIEMGEMKFLFESVSLSGIVENIISVISARADEKQITVEKNIPETLPLIRADRDRLVQILLNILDNAVKFTPEKGKVSISAKDKGDGTVEIRISDTGIGVPQNEISRLGERFYRVEKTRSRELGGTGLGLSIVKHLMTAHGGEIEIQSRLGVGTTVSLFFPIYQGV
jgi:two-component system phosphate regulon sensor histidine kinase PhoR